MVSGGRTTADDTASRYCYYTAARGEGDETSGVSGASSN